jgi:hypothetical protein
MKMNVPGDDEDDDEASKIHVAAMMGFLAPLEIPSGGEISLSCGDFVILVSDLMAPG